MKPAKLYFAALVIIFPALYALPSEPKYKVSDIPKNLLTDAKAVVRNSETTFDITAINKAVMSKKYAITILNQNGLDYSIFAEGYNKFLSVRKIEWNIYDQNGIPVRLSSSVEVQDYSAIAGYSLYEDTRVKVVDPKYRTTPFTIEYSYEIAFDGLFFMPDWNPSEDFNTSVEKSSFTVTAPAGYELRYTEQNLTTQVTTSKVKDKNVWAWSAENLNAIRDEPYGLPIGEITPHVFIAPSDFEIDGYSGSMRTWSDFGKWMNLLNSDRDVLSPETIARVKELTEGKKTELEKIDALYQFMQKKVRYVNITVGIGGWQTIPAGTVDRLSYGDCKALSNYMMSLLKAAGIKSHFTLVGAGSSRSPVRNNFSSNQFNHAILCIPQPNDTIWLECTSQSLPTGFLGKFTDDRHALINTPEGGKLVRTKVYTKTDNIQFRRINLTISTDGNALATVDTKYGGVEYDDVQPLLLMDDTDRKKSLQKSIDIKSFEILKYKHSEIRAVKPSIKESLELKINGHGIIVGNRMLINPNLMTRFSGLPSRTRERKSGIRLRRESLTVDTVIVRLPVGYKFEGLPENTIYSSKFGSYETRFIPGTNEITYIRKLEVNKGDFPAADYDEFLGFLEKIATSDEKRIPLVKVI
jgi:transglutaminase-like putative cysteine protease